MRRSFVAVLLLMATALVLVLASSLPRGYAQTVTPQGDEFDGGTFQAPFTLQCGANVPTGCPDSPGPGKWSLTERPGFLRIWTQFGSLVGGPSVSNNARNLVMQPFSSNVDWTITTSLTFPGPANVSAQALGQTAGLIVWGDDDNFIYVGRIYPSGGGASQLQFLQETAAVDTVVTVPEPTLSNLNNTVYLRITKTGNTYTAYYSYDNVNFTQFTAPPTATVGAGTPTPTPIPQIYAGNYSRVGLFAWGGTNPTVSSNMIPADFDWFRVGPNSMTPAPTLPPTSTATATSTATSTATLVPSVTPTPTATATSVPTATATNTPIPTSTSTPVPTATPKPTVIQAAFRWISVWYHVVRRGTYDVVELQARNSSTHGIWMHVYFPYGKPLAYYTNTNSRGFWHQLFRVPRSAWTKVNNQAVITLRLWKGRTHRDAHKTFVIVR